MRYILLLGMCFTAAAALSDDTVRRPAKPSAFRLSLHQAETDALKSSNQFKASIADEEAAQDHASAQFMALLPQLSVQGAYQYITTVPDLVVLPGIPALQFESKNSYSIGPVLKYTLWDTFSNLKSYHALSRLADARREDRRNEQLQLLLAVREAYVEVQLDLEALRLIGDSLNLARAQDRDIATRVRAGAASRLDRVTSQRSVLSYQLQFEQRQSNLASALKDLIALTGEGQINGDAVHPGPPGAQNVSLVLRLDSLKETLAQQMKASLSQPDERQPQLRSLALQAESSELTASSTAAKLLPTVQVSAKTSLDYPNGPIFEQIHQNTFIVNVSMPLYLGDSSWSQAAQQRRMADAARFREEQLKINLLRDFAKAQSTLNSLLEQQKLSAQDVQASEESARLFYISYQAGRNNILDVQTANNQALQAKVNAAGVDAQILTQLITLKALSGKEVPNE